MLKTSAGKGLATKRKIVDAALATIKREGFAGTSARVIATRGGFNQALIFYHFGSLKDLMLAALDATSSDRMARYSQALEEVGSPADLLGIARTLHLEDIESGHITVLAEMIAGSINDPELGAAITTRMQPWIDLAQRAVERAVVGTPFEALLPTRDIAYALVSFYIGADLLTALDGESSRTEGLFRLAERSLPFIDMRSNDA